MADKFYRTVADLGWGDISWLASLVRTIVKILLALFLALVLHEAIATRFLTVPQTRVNDVARHFEAVSAAVVSKISPNNADGDYSKVSLCIYAAPNPETEGCPDLERPDGTEGNPLKDGSASGLAYAIVGEGGPLSPRLLTSGTFFRVDKLGGVISEGRIEESIDTLLRRLEIALFNGPQVHATEIELCAGTRTLAGAADCERSANIGRLLGAPTAELLPPATAKDAAKKAAIVTPNHVLPQIIADVRIASMFVGPIQYGTMVLFFYAVIETFGLWFRWVLPSDRLGFAGDPDNATTKKQIATQIDQLQKERVLSLHDRMMLVSMKAVKAKESGSGIAVAQPAGNPVAQSSTDAGFSTSPVSLAPHEEFVEVLSSHRDFLQEDAVARQDALEMLGDTMLKLAFLGTVYGISAALFSARGLDTADPILRLSTKAAMYAGIGLGFGTTIVGIALSIVAAILRTNLASVWSREIGAAYQIIFKAGAHAIGALVEQTPQQALEKAAQSLDSRKRSRTERFGSFVVMIIVLALFVGFWNEIWMFFDWVLGNVGDADA